MKARITCFYRFSGIGGRPNRRGWPTQEKWLTMIYVNCKALLGGGFSAQILPVDSFVKLSFPTISGG